MNDLWAITCFFNPAGYRRRLQNYRWFRERLATPLVTVELSFTGRFALGPGDADVLVQLDEGDILFQKERLLNVALAHVPTRCAAVAWIDCDVIFGSADWPHRTLEALDRFALVQPFSERYDLAPDSRPADIATWNRPCDRLSLMATIARDGTTRDAFQGEERQPVGRPAWGLVWAARRDLLDAHGLYDACVLTSGDVAIFCAGWGLMDSPYMRRRMNAPSFEHYLKWAGPFYDATRGLVGHADGRLYHLWHGSIAERRYSTCVYHLLELGFDPSTDIAMTSQGTWRWSSDKPALHALVRDYFWMRNEDDERPLDTPAAERPA